MVEQRVRNDQNKSIRYKIRYKITEEAMPRIETG